MKSKIKQIPIFVITLILSFAIILPLNQTNILADTDTDLNNKVYLVEDSGISVTIDYTFMDEFDVVVVNNMMFKTAVYYEALKEQAIFMRDYNLEEARQLLNILA